ncbi:MAG: flagellar biosynthesis protein FlhB [Methylophilaceae bacterium]
MADGSDLEKTEQATPKRLEKARKDGDVPRSRELGTVTLLLAAGLGMLMMGEHLSSALKTTLSSGLKFDRATAFDPVYLIMNISESIYTLLIAFSPFALLLMIVALGSPAFIGGWLFSGKALAPKFNRLNPIKGVTKLVSKNSAVELVKSILKAILVGGVSYMVMSSDMGPILSLSSLPVKTSIGEVSTLMQTGFLSIVSALIVIAAIDVPYQLYQHAHKLKMTKEEVRQETKELEGNPEIKARIRQQQREMAKRRMMSEIPNADVIVTNPTHYAVAIKYKEDDVGAPIIVAKGADVLALKIREIAAEHKIMTLESPKLARALFAHAELESEIPEALYSAVAEILAYVFQMRIFNDHGGLQPEIPSTLAVPEALDPHSLLPTESTVDMEALSS